MSAHFSPLPRSATVAAYPRKKMGKLEPLIIHSLTTFSSFLPQTTSNSGETSTSVLTYTPRPEDNGKTVRCRATNPELHRGVLEDNWKLDVQCKYLRRTESSPILRRIEAAVKEL